MTAAPREPGEPDGEPLHAPLDMSASERRARARSPSSGAHPITFIFSFALVILVSLALAGPRSLLFGTIVISTTLAVVALQLLFPSSRLLWIAFVNLISVYASVFALFIEDVFGQVGTLPLSIGFALPIASFLIGCWRQRAAITAIVTNPTLGGERAVIKAIAWLLPVFVVGACVIALSQLSQGQINSSPGFLTAMLLIGLIVLAASRDVAIFLVDTGLLFDEFFERVAHLLLPAFAFLTFYSLIILVFASLYSIISRFALEAHFRVGLEAKALSFPEALHFSVVTLSTVGYGDIVPMSTLARTLAAIEVVLGTLLLLFGVSEILAHAKDRGRLRRHGHQE